MKIVYVISVHEVYAAIYVKEFLLHIQLVYMIAIHEVYVAM